MSKTVDYLKELQEKRANKSQSSKMAPPDNKYTRAINTTESSQKENIPRGAAATKKLPVIILGMGIIVSIGFNIIALFYIKDIASEKKSTNKKLAEIEQSLGKAIRKFEAVGLDIKKSDDNLLSLKNKLKDTNQKVSRLEEDFDKTKESMQFNIENLAKAKNALLNKVSALTTKMDGITNTKQP